MRFIGIDLQPRTAHQFVELPHDAVHGFRLHRELLGNGGGLLGVGRHLMSHGIHFVGGFVYLPYALGLLPGSGRDLCG